MQIENGELKKVEDSDTMDGKFVIPDGVTSIGTFAFHKCYSLTSVIIPSSVKSIEDGAFYECDSLASIIIPEGVTSIRESAFFKCTSLTSIIIPKSTTLIDKLAFAYCTSLISIIIPDSVTIIGEFAFYGCSSLASITLPKSDPLIDETAFSDCEPSAIYIKVTTKEDYDRILSLLPENIKQKAQAQLREEYELLLERGYLLLAAAKNKIGFFSNENLPLELSTQMIGNLAEQYNIPQFMIPELMAESVARKFNNNSQSMNDKPEQNDVIPSLPM